MKRFKIELIVGLFVMAGILCAGYLTVKLGKMEILSDEYYELEARFYNVSGLSSGARIELSGVPVGKVSSIAVDKEDQKAIVRLKIKKDIKLDDEVTASVKTSGLIGDKYIKLKPGSGEETLGDHDAIEETESSVDLEELISKYVFGGV